MKKILIILAITLMALGLRYITSYDVFTGDFMLGKECDPMEIKNMMYFPCIGEEFIDTLKKTQAQNVSCVNCTARGCFVTSVKEVE